MSRVSSVGVVFFVFSLTLTVGYWYLLAPRVQQISKGFATIEALDEYAAQAATSAVSQAKEQLLVNQLVSERESVVTPLLPEDESIYDLSIQLESWARTSGVTLTSLNVQGGAVGGLPATSSGQAKEAMTVVAPSGVTQQPIIISASGNYQSLKRYAAGLTQLNRAIHVREVAFTGTDANQSVQITATAFSYPSK